MAVAITIVLVAIAIVAHVPNAHVGQPRHFRASVSVLVVCTCILGALVMSLPKTASCTDTRSSFALLRFDTVPFVAHAGFRGVSIQRQWSRCPTRSGHSPIARLEVGTLLNSKLLNSKWVRADVNATRSGHLLKHLRNFATSSNGHLLKCHLPTWIGHLPRRGRRPRQRRTQ